MNKKIKKYIILLCVLVCGSIGCKNTAGNVNVNIGGGDDTSEGSIQVYYVDRNGTKLVSTKYTVKAEETEARIDEVLYRLERNSSDNTYISAKPAALNIVKITLNNGSLGISFDIAYNELTDTQEVLLKASYVMSLTQLEGIDTVTFYVNDQPILDKSGNVAGAMRGTDFVDNSSNYINKYNYMQLILYFANEDGTKLRREIVDCVYSKNVSLERYVMEQLIKGPSGNNGYKTINSGVRLNSVFTKDGICYVDFDSSVTRRTIPVTNKIMIYSIVNSLSELSHINKVQISVNGSSNIILNGMSMKRTISRNLDVIESVGENR